ncbi:MAG: hypothetical protein WCQ99_03780, partial [Pseudomonadota bacterium]
VPRERRMSLRTKGMLDGIVASRGDKGIYSKKLGRNFALVDLLRWNMFELFPLRFTAGGEQKKGGLCSSISAWGKGTKDGSALMVRDLDFGSPGDLLEQSSIMIAYHSQALVCPEKSWVSWAFPGIIGCLTGMNEDGVGAAVHYATGAAPVEDLLLYIPWVYTPLSFVVRSGLESAGSGLSPDPLAGLYSLISAGLTAGSFNVHVVRPYGSGLSQASPPAAVIEGRSGATGLRTCRENRQDEPRLLSDYFLAATNHHRKIDAPEPCERYKIIVDALNALGILALEAGFAVERDAVQKQSPYHTVQMIGFSADTKDIRVAFARPGSPCYEQEPVHFSWDELIPPG